MVIALDGHSSSGKSTLAKDLSSLLSVSHIDSGAMYRAITLYFIRHNVDINNKSTVAYALESINISFKVVDGKTVTVLNGSVVESDIRTMEVSDLVSDVAAISSVRRYLVSQQRRLADAQSIIMDGRDIGTVVFPEADVKLFVTASIEVRTQRRYDELKARGVEITIDEVRANLTKRDHIDSTREDSPLKQAEDAILLDTGSLDRSAMIASATKMIHEKMIKNNV